MCMICEKVDFAIETIESLFPEKELTQAFADSFGMGEKEREEFVKDPMSAHANFISILANRYAIKHNIPPAPFIELFQLVYANEFGRETAERLFEKVFGEKLETHIDLINKKLKDLES